MADPPSIHTPHRHNEMHIPHQGSNLAMAGQQHQAGARLEPGIRGHMALNALVYRPCQEACVHGALDELDVCLAANLVVDDVAEGEGLAAGQREGRGRKADKRVTGVEVRKRGAGRSQALE